MNTTIQQALIKANQIYIDKAKFSEPILALTELRALRLLIKAAEEQISQISDQAIAEAAQVLNNDGKSQGEFECDGHKFQLQITETYDFHNFRRYNDADAALWRGYHKKRAELKASVASITKLMKAVMDNYKIANSNRTPDEIKATIKVID